MRKPNEVHLNIAVGDPRKIKTEDYKRSAHNDFATESELRDRKFSGLRANKLSEEFEVWMEGSKIGTISQTDYALKGDQAVEEFFSKVFKI